MHTYLLHQLLSDSAARVPDENVVVFGDRSMVYSELDRRSDQVASALTELGVKVGDRIGIFLNKSVEFIVFLFGILKAGAAYIPIDFLAPRNRVEYILDHSGVQVLFTNAEGARKILPSLEGGSSRRTIIVAGGEAGQGAKVLGNPGILAAEELFYGRERAAVPAGFPDTHPAFLLHTSGSTGMPKGVGLSHLNALTFVNMAAEYFHVHSEDRLACHAPLQFDLTVFDIFVAVRKGAAVVLVPEHLSVFPMKLAQFIEEERITVWNSVASVLSLLAERGRMERYRFDSLRTVIFSGDVLPVKHLRKLKTLLPHVRFFNVYGQTEANSSTCYPIDELPEGDAWRIPIGKAFPNFEVFALDENGVIIHRSGQVGELHVRSSSVAMGYWGDPEKTAESFVTDPGSRLSNRKVYRTGDLVTLDEASNYVFLGRKDHQVKIRGYRVQLNEIEAVLNNHPSVKEAAVFAIPDVLLGNRILSHLVAAEGPGLTEIELSDYCSRILPAYMVPEKFIFHDRFQRTSTGKIDKKSLMESTKNSIP